MKKKAYPFPPGGLPPYLQSFIVTMESGAVILARVMGEDSGHGRGLAHAAAQELFPCQIWDDSAYPIGPEEQAKGPGLDILKGAADSVFPSVAHAIEARRRNGEGAEHGA